MVDAYRDPFQTHITELGGGLVAITTSQGEVYEAGPDRVVDYSAPAEVIAAQFPRWRKPQGPTAPLELPE